MGYNINRSEINMTAGSCLGNGKVIAENLSKIRESFNGLIENENFTGNGADAIKQYLYFVHLTAIDSIIAALEEFYSLAAQYAAGFSNYDSFDEAVVNEDYLTEIIGKMKAMLLSMEEARNDPFNAEDGVMDLLPDRILKLLWAYQDPLENEEVRLKKLRDGIATYDADFKANKFQNIRELLADSERLVNLIKEKGIVTFEGMNPADYFTDEQYEKILVNISDSYTYLLENKDNILNDTQFVVDYVIKVEEREKNEAKKHRIEKGIILILTGSMAIGTIIATAGTSGPLIAELAWTAGATYIGADSTAMTIEGIQEIYYGLNNDFETQSFNGVRDGLFRGNQKYYDLANLIIYSGFTCTCSYKNICTAGTEALKNGGSVEFAKIGACGEEVFKTTVGTAADFAGEKIAQSCSDDMLAQFVIQKTFSIGVQKGTDKAAKSFGAGFSNKMSKYVGKAGATSTKGSPKIGDANVDMPETLKVKEPEVHIDNPNTLTYKSFEKETFSSGFDYESMYEKQYLDDFSYEEHFANGDIDSINTKDLSGIKNQEISYASFEGEYEPIKLQSKDHYPESPMFGEDWNKDFQDKYGSKNVSWETGSFKNGDLNKTKVRGIDTVVKGTQQTLKKYYKIDEGKLTETNKQKLVVDMKKIYDDADKRERGDVLVPENSKDVNSVYYNQYIDKYDVSYNWKDIDTVIETRKMEILKEGQQFDRVGPPTGRCTGAVGEDGSCASVKERSIPYHFKEKNITEEPSYHRYVVEQDFTEENLLSAIENSMYSDDKKIKMQENLKEYYRRSRDKGYGDGDGLATGIIAPMFEETTGATGGGTQYDMPFNMKELEEIGMITEVSKNQY